MDRHHCPPSTHGPSKERRDRERHKEFEKLRDTEHYDQGKKGQKMHTDKYMSKEKADRYERGCFVARKETGKC